MAIAPTVLIGCPGDDPPPLFVEAAWQVHCDIQGGCLLPPSRAVSGIDGENGVDLFCSTIPTGDSVVVTMRALASEFGLEFQGLSIPLDGGDIGGSSCQVMLTEGPNQYTGACGPAVVGGGCLEDPEISSNSCDQACQIFDVSIDSGDPPTIRGSIYCQGLSLIPDPLRVVELTNTNAASSGLNAQNSPFSFVIEACEGL